MSPEPISVEVPDIGDFDAVPIIEILVGPGDTVAVDDPLLTLESDKAAMDVPAPAAGTVGELHVKIGDQVSQGTLLLTLEPDGNGSVEALSAGGGGDAGQAEATNGGVGDADQAEAEATDGAETPEGGADRGETPADGGDGGQIYASPSVRRLAREAELDLSAVTGSGRKGRITKADVEGLLQERPAPPQGAGPGGYGLELAPWPPLEFERFGPVERVARGRIAKLSGPNLARNWVMIPHVTHHDEADVTELDAWRKRLNEEHAGDGVKVTMVSFLIVACVATLREYPDFNSSLDGDELVRKRYWNIGFAADTPGGLVVPVIKGAERKGLLELARELSELSARARAGKLTREEMSGGSFTISSLGGIGGTGFTPIINAPEVAILGVTRAAIKPVWDIGEFVPRLIVPLSLSYDHRVIDGAAAARFLVRLASLLADLRQALL
ncbi:MAG: 2-oxo acid dehydrogenase subunit E2 [Solirubrobacteraceae bacterium]